MWCYRQEEKDFGEGLGYFHECKGLQSRNDYQKSIKSLLKIRMKKIIYVFRKTRWIICSFAGYLAKKI